MQKDPDRYQGLIHVGTVVVSKRPTHVSDRREQGVCFEINPPDNTRQSPSKYGFIFQSGRYDWFTIEELDHFYIVTGEKIRLPDNYGFSTRANLRLDYSKGVFDVGLHTLL